MKHGIAAGKILDAAEKMMRERGYHGVSFRDVAAVVGIKSASVHYHFPSKEDLALALVDRYADRFLDAARDTMAAADGLEQKIDVYCGLFKQAFTQDARMCLCGMFAAEADGLPAEARLRVAQFFADNLALLETVYQEYAADTPALKGAARLTLSSLEGAMLLARVDNGAQPLEQAGKDLQNMVPKLLAYDGQT